MRVLVLSLGLMMSASALAVGHNPNPGHDGGYDSPYDPGQEFADDGPEGFGHGSHSGGDGWNDFPGHDSNNNDHGSDNDSGHGSNHGPGDGPVKGPSTEPHPGPTPNPGPPPSPGKLKIFILEGVGDGNSMARDVNASNTIVGEMQSANGETHAFVFNSQGGIRDIGVVKGGNYSSANAISDNGIVVGVLNLPANGEGAGPTRGFSWKDNVLSVLPPLSGTTNCSAEDVNVHSQIIGECDGIATLWQSGQARALGTLGGLYSFATGINQNAWIVGNSATASGEWRAFLWRDNTMTDLGTLGGRQSFATDINDSGRIIGNSETNTMQVQTFMWENGVMTNADRGAGASTGNGLSRLGRGAGGANFSGGPLHAALWDLDGSLVDLGVLPGMDFSYAHAVTDSQIIVGYSFSADPAKGRKAVFWQPTRD